MWLTDWAETSESLREKRTPEASSVDLSSVSDTYLLAWNEHCLECAVPDCYSLCPLYVARRDRKCARFKKGILPNTNYPGLFPFGAEVEFRRWGKLESTFGYGAVTIAEARAIGRLDRMLLRFIRPLSTLFQAISPSHRLNGAYAVGRERLLQSATRGKRADFDEFLIETWNLKPEPVRLILELWQEGLKFRASILLGSGRTVQKIPYSSLNVDLCGAEGMIRLYPENNAEAHIVFSWLDFVRYKGERQASRSVTDPVKEKRASSTKVKCVIWDLDRTVWNGILGEQEGDKVTLRPSVLNTMKALDERGILQSVASKNDHDEAWRVLERFQLSDLFLFPQINWQPKSVSVKKIVDALNIGIDSCVFVDDSAFERAEVSHECPGIRVFSEVDVPALLDRSEFDVPVTSESKRRRELYQAESRRQQATVAFGDRYEVFLQSCGMEAVLFRPTEPEHFERCLELLHRSNQLNLSTYRYTRDEFMELLKRPQILAVCTSCRDRFGDYGIVGFASIDASNGELVLKDFIMSCRVAKKKLENAWFKSINDLAILGGYRSIRAKYGKTSRNGVLRQVLQEVGFIEQAKEDVCSILELPCDHIPVASEIVSVTTASLSLPKRSETLLAAG